MICILVEHILALVKYCIIDFYEDKSEEMKEKIKVNRKILEVY